MGGETIHLSVIHVYISGIGGKNNYHVIKPLGICSHCAPFLLSLHEMRLVIGVYDYNFKRFQDTSYSQHDLNVYVQARIPVRDTQITTRHCYYSILETKIVSQAVV